jgi:hypothetical protein
MKRHRRTAKQTHVPLVILVGLPHPICAAVGKVTEDTLLPSPRVIFQASGADNRNLYKQHTVAELMRAVSGYANRQLEAKTVPPTPAQILLAYVPASDEEQLLAEFDFFVFPVRLSRLAEYDERGRQYRHDRKVAEDYVVATLQTALISFVEVKRRLSSPSPREPLFLPPCNFKISNAERMADLFREMRQAKRPWGSPLPDIRTAKVTHEQIRKIPAGKQMEVFSDFRSLLFPHDRSYHGLARELPFGCSHEVRKQFMRSSFRFGVPLIDGFHHDVQFGGRSLGGETFECSQKGSLQLSCSHANVYPNDFVRPSTK